VFKFPDDWYIKPTFTKIRENIYMHFLPNNKLLLHYSLEERKGNCKVSLYYWNKIYILDLNNYRLIHSFKEFKWEIKIIVLSNYICIESLNKLYIYNINDYKLVNNINLELNISSIKKYKDNILIEFSTSDKNIIIILLDISNVKMIKKCILNIKHIKGIILDIYTLNNLNILAISRDITDKYIYILQVNNLNFK